MSVMFKLYDPCCAICGQPADWGAVGKATINKDKQTNYYCDRHRPRGVIGTVVDTRVTVMFGEGVTYGRDVQTDVILRAFHDTECSEGWAAAMLGVNRLKFRGMYQDWLKENDK